MGSVVLLPRAKPYVPSDHLLRLGRALRALRQRRGLKQIEVAAGADMTESQVSDLERGQGDARWTTVLRVLEMGLGATIADLAAAYVADEEGGQDGSQGGGGQAISAADESGGPAP